ncbi:MAG: tetratricopeptide repeat protein, partial [Candidatus Omnitrophica bacterium]|nr:tetratricopeptide repeat protein [Candidatus Omnitrophota bacterium]
EMAPDDPRVHFYLGAYYENINDNVSAAKHFRDAIRLDPYYADAYNYLGYMFAEDGVELDEALELTKRAVALEPESGAFLDSLGWVLFKKGMTDEALMHIEKALRAMPDDPTIREHLGDIYFKQGLREKAREEWSKSLEFDPEQEKVREKLKGR